jgi:hypothetical protein
VFQAQEPEIVANMLTILTHSWALKRYNLKKFSLYHFEKTLIQFVLNGLMKTNETETETQEVDNDAR